MISLSSELFTSLPSKGQHDNLFLDFLYFVQVGKEIEKWEQNSSAGSNIPCMFSSAATNRVSNTATKTMEKEKSEHGN